MDFYAVIETKQDHQWVYIGTLTILEIQRQRVVTLGNIGIVEISNLSLNLKLQDDIFTLFK